MAVIELYRDEPKRKNRLGAKLFHCLCDNCGTEFDRSNCYTEFVFCSTNCVSASKRPGGILYRTTSEARAAWTDEERNDILLKCTATSQKNYGCDNPFQSPEIQMKIEETNLRKRGFKSHNSDPIVKAKKIESYLKNFGVDHPMKSPNVIETCRQVSMENYGVAWYSKSEIVQDKMKSTMVERFGVEYPLQSEEIKAKLDYEEIFRKKHETMKKNGGYASSKIEKKLIEELRISFIVEEQADVNGWSIDAYIENHNVYLQLDGDYWHGLDRTIEEIAMFQTKRDVEIHRRRLFDEGQTRWFKDNKIMFVRIKESDYRKRGVQFVIEKIEHVEV